MARALCWLAARLAGLSTVVPLGPDRILLLFARPFPAWAELPMRWLLARAGHVRPGEHAVTVDALGAAARARAAAAAPPRVEFVRGPFAAFRARALREAWDFRALAADA